MARSLFAARPRRGALPTNHICLSYKLTLRNTRRRFMLDRMEVSSVARQLSDFDGFNLMSIRYIKNATTSPDDEGCGYYFFGKENRR